MKEKSNINDHKSNINDQKSNINDHKSNMKASLKAHLLIAINKYDEKHKKSKIKSGRPNALSNELCLDAIFYVLIEGVTWIIASKLATNEIKYKSSIHRKFLNWIKAGIIKESYDKILSSYIASNPINELYIDSTDIQNKNMTKNKTYKSFKLNKQAIRLTIVGDSNTIPIDYTIRKAHMPDNVLGYEQLINLKAKLKKKTFVYGDKGYQMTAEKRKTLLKTKKLELIVPKRQYKKRKCKNPKQKSKRKPIRHSKKMKEGLERRIRIEHINSILHRSYKRLNRVSEKTIKSFEAFLLLAMSMMIINKKI